MIVCYHYDYQSHFNCPILRVGCYEDPYYIGLRYLC